MVQMSFLNNVSNCSEGAVECEFIPGTGGQRRSFRTTYSHETSLLCGMVTVKSEQYSATKRPQGRWYSSILHQDL